MKEQYWKYSLIFLILLLGVLLFRQAQPFMNGILAAFTLYLLLRRFICWLKLKINSLLAVWLVTIGTTLFILLPLSLFGWALFDQLSSVHIDARNVLLPAQHAIELIKRQTGFDMMSEKSLSFIVEQASAIGQRVMSGVSDFFVNFAVAILLLFFMLKDGERMECFVSSILPFRPENKREVMHKIVLIVRSNAIGIPMLAFFQGAISLGGYLLSDIPDPLLAAVLTAFASIIPIVGTALIWIPVSVYLLLIGEWERAMVLLVYGSVVISQCDNFIRFALQKRMADIHPLVTLFGVVAGLPIFGFMGIIFGPLMVSLFLLFLDMFRKEYLLSDDVVGR